MLLLELLQRLISGKHNPELDRARRNHDSLPEYRKSNRLSIDELERDKKTTFQRSYELGKLLKAAIEEHYCPLEQDEVRDILLKAVGYLATKARIFPDIDNSSIWYTDYYDLIELAKDMGLGDDTLPHWPEESNHSKRYLEINVSDLLQMFLSFSEEALIEKYKFGVDLDSWVKYLLRETLKSRQRFARERQKQAEALRFSPDILKVIEQERSRQQSDQFL